MASALRLRGPHAVRLLHQRRSAAPPPCCWKRRYCHQRRGRRTLVSLHGSPTVFSTAAAAAAKVSYSSRPPLLGNGGQRPRDPHRMLSDGELQERIQAVINWLSTKESVLVLTGAGISTESGVPDYRGHNGSYHDGHQPMLHQQFMTSSTHRQRYWARGMVGWRSFSSRRPNAGHVALAELEKRGVVGVSFHDSADFYDEKDPTAVDARDRGPEKLRSLTVVTQNVDSLHQRSGSRQVLDLHGRGDMVRCMSCGATSPRSDYHDRLERENADWLAKAFEHLSTQSTAMRPDGDAVLSSVSDYSNLRVPNCESCGVGFVKPDVVFFGDSVPRNRVELCNAAVSASDGILVVGTSLAVHSAYRHVRAATQRGTPVCILNVGETRAEIDGLPGIIKVEAPVGATLSGVAAHYNFS